MVRLPKKLAQALEFHRLLARLKRKEERLDELHQEFEQAIEDLMYLESSFSDSPCDASKRVDVTVVFPADELVRMARPVTQRMVNRVLGQVTRRVVRQFLSAGVLVSGTRRGIWPGSRRYWPGGDHAR